MESISVRWDLLKSRLKTLETERKEIMSDLEALTPEYTMYNRLRRESSEGIRRSNQIRLYEGQRVAFDVEENCTPEEQAAYAEQHKIPISTVKRRAQQHRERSRQPRGLDKLAEGMCETGALHVERVLKILRTTFPPTGMPPLGNNAAIHIAERTFVLDRLKRLAPLPDLLRDLGGNSPWLKPPFGVSYWGTPLGLTNTDIIDIAHGLKAMGKIDCVEKWLLYPTCETSVDKYGETYEKPQRHSKRYR